jgi:hypothetical protein
MLKISTDIFSASVKKRRNTPPQAHERHVSADYFQIHSCDFFQIQGDLGTAVRALAFPATATSLWAK